MKRFCIRFALVVSFLGLTVARAEDRVAPCERDGKSCDDGKAPPPVEGGCGSGISTDLPKPPPVRPTDPKPVPVPKPHLSYEEAKNFLIENLPKATKLRTKSLNGQEQWQMDSPRCVVVTKRDRGEIVIVTVLPEPETG